MKRELTCVLPKLVQNELMGGPTENWLNRCSWTVTAPKVVDAIWLKSLPPLNYKSVQSKVGGTDDLGGDGGVDGCCFDGVDGGFDGWRRWMASMASMVGLGS